MAHGTDTEQFVLETLKRLSPDNKQLAMDLIKVLLSRQTMAPPPPSRKAPRETFEGTLSGPIPSEEEIRGMRREAWGNFPREAAE